jgi:2-haloacid dehalogenase
MLPKGHRKFRYIPASPRASRSAFSRGALRRSSRAAEVKAKKRASPITFRGVKVSDRDRQGLTEKFSTMPPHPEVPAALRKLRSAGFRLFTLTDNLIEVQERQLGQGGIIDLFERRFSADSVHRHKPAPETYAHVEKALDAKPSEFCLIACHTWDYAGRRGGGLGSGLNKTPVE